MADAIRPDLAPADALAPVLDAERLDCYAVALEFHVLAGPLAQRAGHVLRDQLERASLSIVLNIAEGAGRFSPPDKARFFAIARGSATECAAVVDVIGRRGLATADDCRRARSLLVRAVQMLTRLTARQIGRGGAWSKDADSVR